MQAELGIMASSCTTAFLPNAVLNSILESMNKQTRIILRPCLPKQIVPIAESIAGNWTY